MSARDPKSAVLTVRVTPQQKALLEQAAAVTGLSVSALLLVHGLEAARKAIGNALPPPSAESKRSGAT